MITVPSSSSSAAPILVTGASGFLGAAVADALAAQGAPLVTTSRSASPVRADTPHHPCDLADPAAAHALVEAVAPRALIHIAARLSGSDEDHARDTVAPTETLARALAASGDPADPARFVLASSFSVYDYAALAQGAVLDEAAALEAHPADRDAYTRAKLAQERVVREQATAGGLEAQILRPGFIVGKGREWVAGLGMAKGPLLVMYGGGAPLPLVSVADCAEAFALAALAPMSEGQTVQTLNIVGNDQPTQRAYLAQLPARPKLTVPVPWSLLDAAAAALAPLKSGLPTGLKRATIAARAKPLTFSNKLAKTALGWSPTS